MRSLRLDDVPDPLSNFDLSNFEEVPVPEMGIDEDGEAGSEELVVLVRAMSVFEWDQLMRSAWTTTETENGETPGLKLKQDYNELCLVAAMCSYDDQGNLVFGVDIQDANERLKNLHRKYRPALQRIHKKALEMSGQGYGSDIQSGQDRNEKTAEEAEKN